MEEVTKAMLEGLAVGGLEGLVAAGFYSNFFGSGRGAVLAGTGIGICSLVAFWQPGLLPVFFVLSACWMMLAGGLYKHGQRQELFLAGGTWLFICSFACLWPSSAPLQIVSAMALFGMAALFLLRRGELHPLWMGTLLCLWLLTGFLKGMVYQEDWQEQGIKAASYLVLGGMIVFGQVACILQERKRRDREEDGHLGRMLPKAEEREKQSSGGEAKDWRKAADQEYRRLQIFEHDFRHHLDMLGALYEKGNPAEARAYLEDLKQARVNGKGRKIGGERELAYIMMAKKEACRKAGIEFSCQILGSPRGIAQMDMTALLLNLLDNAIRACEKALEPRSIGIMLLSRGELWQIELVNTGRYESQGKRQESFEQIEKSQEGVMRGKTGEGKPAHGIGLVSVRQIVEKYQGIFEIRQEGDFVVQKVILTGRLPD